MTTRKYKQYSKEFKLEAIRLADNSDKPVTQVARELVLRVNQLYKWRQQLELKRDEVFPGKGQQIGKDAEILRLKRALTAAQEENAFLKKTAVYFAKNQP